MTTLLTIGLILSVILNLILFYRSYVMVKVVERTQDQLFQNADITLDTLEQMLEDMRDLDLRGAFESDDEVGAVFQELKTLIEEYKINLNRKYGTKEEEETLLYERNGTSNNRLQ